MKKFLDIVRAIGGALVLLEFLLLGSMVWLDEIFVFKLMFSIACVIGMIWIIDRSQSLK